jgi:hypothetical protein
VAGTAGRGGRSAEDLQSETASHLREPEQCRGHRTMPKGTTHKATTWALKELWAKNPRNWR